MEPIEFKNILSLDEKIRLFNGVGSWETYTAGGKIPNFFMSDGPHGLRKQTAENYRDLNKSNIATCFPTASCVASSWDENVARELGEAIATEAKCEKVNLMLGPGMNIKRSPLCGRNFEYFSEDPLLTAKMAAAYVDGMQSQGVGACIKHFACNNQEKRRQTSSSNIDEKTLRKIYLSAFEYVVKNSKPAAVMCSYNKLNGTYICHHRHLLTEILREEWKYEGVVISDWGACIDAQKCLKAGMDLAMPDSFGYFDKQLKEGLNTNTISENDLNIANQRLIKMIQDYSFDSKETTPVDFTKQHKIALDIAEKSAVLLKNKEILPLNPAEKPKLLVIGALAEKMKYQGGGSSHISTAEYPNALETLKAAGFDVTYEPGYIADFCPRKKAIKKNLPLLLKAVAATQKASLHNQPVIVFAGLTEAYEGEGFDRQNLEIPPEQHHLIHQVLDFSQNVILVTFSGAPIDLSVAHRAKAILHMYLCGEACGEAVTNLLTGKVTPSGKLAETWPLKIEDTPSYGNFACDHDEVNYIERELVGYRWYNEKNLPVQFPFGYGLSYTEFKTSINDKDCNLITLPGITKIYIPENKDAVQIKIKNTGKFSGAEVIQCYKNGELCGFKKIYLEPQEEKDVLIDNLKNWYTNYEAYDINADHKNEPSKKTHFVMADSLGDMAECSLRIRMLLKIISRALAFMNKKSIEDPAVKIEIAAIYENPLESLISTSGGVISEKFARKLLKWANKK